MRAKEDLFSLSLFIHTFFFLPFIFFIFIFFLYLFFFIYLFSSIPYDSLFDRSITLCRSIVSSIVAFLYFILSLYLPLYVGRSLSSPPPLSYTYIYMYIYICFRSTDASIPNGTTCLSCSLSKQTTNVSDSAFFFLLFISHFFFSRFSSLFYLLFDASVLSRYYFYLCCTFHWLWSKKKRESCKNSISAFFFLASTNYLALSSFVYVNFLTLSLLLFGRWLINH